MHKVRARLFNLRDSSRNPSLHLICALRARPNPIIPREKTLLKLKNKEFNLPVGGKRKIQRTANQRQSLGRFGNRGSNFFRRSTTVAVLDAFDIPDDKVRIVNVLE
jgi:hypothetical protein